MKQRWKQLPVAIRKPLILVIGTVIIIGGLILVPLPGPGWVIVFFGFAVLGTEFAFAERFREWVIGKLKIAWQRLKIQWQQLIKRLRSLR